MSVYNSDIQVLKSEIENLKSEIFCRKHNVMVTKDSYAVADFIDWVEVELYEYATEDMEGELAIMEDELKLLMGSE